MVRQHSWRVHHGAVHGMTEVGWSWDFLGEIRMVEPHDCMVLEAAGSGRAESQVGGKEWGVTADVGCGPETCQVPASCGRVQSTRADSEVPRVGGGERRCCCKLWEAGVSLLSLTS